MKVAVVTENYFPTLGGVQEHVYHLKRWLTAQGVGVKVLTGDPGVADRMAPADSGDDVIRVGRAWRYSAMGSDTYATMGPLAMMGLRRALRDGGFDLVHVHGPCDVGLPLLAYAAWQGPIVSTLHSWFPDSRLRRLASPAYQWALSRASAVIAVSESTRATMARYARFPAEIIPNGIDVAWWQAGRPVPGIRDGRVNVLYLGRLEPRNGIDVLLEAFPRIADADPRVHLLVAGDGPGRAGYEAMVPAHLRGRVSFLGAVGRERPDLLASADLFVVPARSVGFSILVLEALAAGLPVVALPAPGVDTAGAHWSTVRLARDATPAALAQAALDALGADNAARVREGKRIVRGFDWDVVAPRVLAVYERALA